MARATDGPQEQPEAVGSDRAWGFSTRSVHAGGVPDPVTGARAVPIYQSTSFVFADAADAASLFALQKYGTIYSRISNPTVAAFEERIASLEGGIGAVATSSGQAAEFLTFAALAGAGDHIVAAAALYGGTFTQLDVTLRRFGIDTTFVAGADPADYAAAVTDRTRCVYAEVVSNPSGQVADLAGLAAVAHDAGVPLVVDATMVTPWVCRPIEHGADIVLHSATKFLGGHGTTLGGVIVESGRFDWGNGKFPLMTEPVASYNGLRWWDNFGEYGFLTRLRSEQLRDIGAALSPLSAFLLLQGVETLPQRMRAHLANARGVAEWLAADDRVSYVRWAGLPGDPFHDRAQRYTPAGPGAVFSFGVRGGRAAGEAFIGAVRLCSHLANVGDVRTLVIHPGSTTHQQLTPDQLVAAGVPEDLVRISVGLEDLDDILWDLDQALAVAVRAGDGSPAQEPAAAPAPAADPEVRQAGVAVGGVSADPGTGGWTPPTARERLAILERTRTVAIVGASGNPARASNFVATYLLASSEYEVFFVNPSATRILGRPVYPSLAALPVVPDLVDTFRRGDALAGVLADTLAVGARTLWLQLGLWDDAVAAAGHAAGIDVVMNRCLKIEHARFHGGLHLAGFDTGVIDSRRGGPGH